MGSRVEWLAVERDIRQAYSAVVKEEGESAQRLWIPYPTNVFLMLYAKSKRNGSFESHTTAV